MLFWEIKMQVTTGPVRTRRLRKWLAKGAVVGKGRLLESE